MKPDKMKSDAGQKLRVLITPVPFGNPDQRPLELMEQSGIEYMINPTGRKIKEDELAELIGGYDALIAGTEPITKKVLDRAPDLRLISRVGVGLDSIDMATVREKGILVCNTPYAHATSVAELTIGLILSMLRYIPQADAKIRNGVWQRYMGQCLENQTVGVIGAGRVGMLVIKYLNSFGSRILAYDLIPDTEGASLYNIQWTDLHTIYKEADIITLHLPLSSQTKGLISRREMAIMKQGVILINTSRGNMIAEKDLAEALRSGQVGGAALDVFGQEPYTGELTTLDKCILTPHIGSMSLDCRKRMELEATEEVIRFFRNEPLLRVVPPDPVPSPSPSV